MPAVCVIEVGGTCTLYELAASVVVMAAPLLTNEVLPCAGNTTVLLPTILKLFPFKAKLGDAAVGSTTVFPPEILKLFVLSAKLGVDEIVKSG